MQSISHIIVQIVLMAAQGVNIWIPLIPVKYQPLAALILATLQGIVGITNHYFNPDGTPAQASWQPPVKKL